MIAERVLDDVGRSPCLALRLFLSVCFNSGIFLAKQRSNATYPASSMTTIMRNPVMHVSTMHDAISDVSSDD